MGKRNKLASYRKEGRKDQKIASVRIDVSFWERNAGNGRVHNKSKIKIGNRGKDRVSLCSFLLCGETDCCVARAANNSRNKYKFMVDVEVTIEN